MADQYTRHEGNIPSNPLVDQHTVDTLIHVQEVLAFLQNYLLKALEESDIIPHDVRVNSGHHTILRMVHDALEYEINRCDQSCLTKVMN